MTEPIKIAICGTRGVPANYGGFETFAEELGVRLVKRGHEITVFCRYYKGAEDLQLAYDYKGISCINLRAFKHKYFETPLHTLLSFLHPKLSKIDLVLLCNAANSPFSFLPRLLGIPVIINVDGIERERRKWNWMGKLWYRLGEFCSVLFASDLVSDANYIHDYYLKRYNRSSTVIRYGARHLSKEAALEKSAGDFKSIQGAHAVRFHEFGVEAGSYLLYVSRLEPENNADKVILGFNELPKSVREKFPLLVVGDAPYADDFKLMIKSIACPEVKFLGYQFGESYEILQSGAYLYIQATEVGGTHPALVEAMGFSNAIVANAVPEHFEVIDGVAEFYNYNDIRDLTAKLLLLTTSENRVLELRSFAFQKAVREYSWEAICDQYEALFKKHL